MIQFKPLELEDRDLFLKYLGVYKFKTYEYSFNTLYLWRKLLNIEYAELKGALVIKKHHKRLGSYFMEPLGYNEDNLGEIIELLREYSENNKEIKNVFRDIEKEFLNILLKKYDNVSYSEDIDNFDYIYNTKDLIRLSGNKYHSKKNHFNQFIKNYSYETRDIKEPSVIRDCIDFSHRWFNEKGVKTDQLMHETLGIEDILKNMDKVNILGEAVYVDNEMAAFTIGEKVNNEMGIIHIEKANPKYKGIYTFINKSFAENYLADTKFINREEDLGVEGLRKAKLSYHPVKLEEKFIIDFN